MSLGLSIRRLTNAWGAGHCAYAEEGDELRMNDGDVYYLGCTYYVVFKALPRHAPAYDPLFAHRALHVLCLFHIRRALSAEVDIKNEWDVAKNNVFP